MPAVARAWLLRHHGEGRSTNTDSIEDLQLSFARSQTSHEELLRGAIRSRFGILANKREIPIRIYLRPQVRPPLLLHVVLRRSSCGNARSPAPTDACVRAWLPPGPSVL